MEGLGSSVNWIGQTVAEGLAVGRVGAGVVALQQGLSGNARLVVKPHSPYIASRNSCYSIEFVVDGARIRAGDYGP